MIQNRTHEALFEAKQAASILQRHNPHRKEFQQAINIISLGEADREEWKPLLGLRALRKWTAHILQAEGQTTHCSDMALYAAQTKQYDVAQHWLHKAITALLSANDPDGYLWNYTRIIQARILLEMGKPEDAIASLPHPIPSPDDPRFHSYFFHFSIYAQAFLAAGEQDEAKKWLNHIYARLETRNIPRLRDTADKIARSL